ncbi:MBL fold metallo-hydrolase, partial [Chloroflexota bacterium]
RGSKQIGGSCVEFESGGKRLLIDLGLPLDAEDDTLQYVPDVKGLDGTDKSLLGVLISHPHLDHFGLLQHISPQIPVGMGAAARRILTAASPFLRGSWLIPPSGWDFKSGTPLSIGPFTVTPYLVDHSAYDAYSFLIEAEEKKVIYSGDFRAHGRKSPLFERYIANPTKGVDAVLLEGSTLGRLDKTSQFPTETDIESRLVKEFQKTKGLVLVQTSAQNIDRVVSIFKACKRSGRKLIIDLYVAAVLEATNNSNIPQSAWKEIMLYIPQYQRIQIKKNEWFDLLNRHSFHRIFNERLKDLVATSVLLFRPVHIRDLEKAGCLENASFIYSQWEGYWERGDYDYLKSWLEKTIIPKTSVHTSGHASIQDLKRLVEALSPKRVIPIHTFYPEQYFNIFHNVVQLNDGEFLTFK